MRIRSDRDGVILEVWVQPRASRSEVAGSRGDALKIRIAAPPVDGQANDALVRFLAKTLGVPRKKVEIVRGESGRTKTVRVRGIDPASVESALGIDSSADNPTA